MRSILFSIGPFHVYGYGFMIALGVIFAFVIGCRLAKKIGLDDDTLFSMGLIGVAGGLVGAKLLYYIVELPEILKNPSILLQVGEGFVVYGGLIAGFLTPVFYARKKKISFFAYLDCAVVGVSVAQGFGRIGCFLAGCCYGMETSAWYGVVFPIDSLAPSKVSLIPTQLISAAGDFVIGIILFILHGIFYKNANDKASGKLSAIYLMLYAAGRFFIEFLRGDPRGNVGILSTSQFIAIFMFTAGAILLAKVSNKFIENKDKENKKC